MSLRSGFGGIQRGQRRRPAADASRLSDGSPGRRGTRWTRAAFKTDLPRTPDAPWLARRTLAGWLGGALEHDELDTAKLLTSELVTNAVVHGQGQIVMRAELDERCALVEVIDGGPGFQRDVRELEIDAVSGRGLAIVERSPAAGESATARLTFGSNWTVSPRDTKPIPGREVAWQAAGNG